MSSKVPRDIAPFGKNELMNLAALPRKCKSMVSSTTLFFIFFQGIECGSAIYCQTHIEIKTSFYKLWALRVGGGSYTDSL